MKKILYLTEIEWSEAWMNGGSVPISLASTYLSDYRFGTKTPDENIIHESPIDLTMQAPLISFEEGAETLGLTLTDVELNGVQMPNLEKAKYYFEDGLVLSFCDSLSSDIARRLGKQAAVEIHSMEDLKMSLDTQLGQLGEMRHCEYTNGHQRNHFLKSTEDEWQEEFRIFWGLDESRDVIIPSGTAQLVEIFR